MKLIQDTSRAPIALLDIGPPRRALLPLAGQTLERSEVLWRSLESCQGPLHFD
jgi:hypothetical protein